MEGTRAKALDSAVSSGVIIHPPNGSSIQEPRPELPAEEHHDIQLDLDRSCGPPTSCFHLRTSASGTTPLHTIFCPCGHIHEDCTNACKFRLPASICEDEYRSFFKRTVESSGAGSLEHLNCIVTEGRHILDALTRG